MQCPSVRLCNRLLGKNTENACTKICIEKGPNRSKGTHTIPRKLRAIFYRITMVGIKDSSMMEYNFLTYLFCVPLIDLQCFQ